jgi:hypothetical protein
MAGQGPLSDYYRKRTHANIRWVGFVGGGKTPADCRQPGGFVSVPVAGAADHGGL